MPKPDVLPKIPTGAKPLPCEDAKKPNRQERKK
ncbi:hypothetical protein CGMCC3_g7767 [Colletotrichum fructicola]|nr:uncharacterized protein CGMCC3_g7767 [Colletotrichum fructicola]KAE9576246.1 hypothetical protein CGMCC3_g7767 [Colletotrichum fructicola]